MDAIIHTYGGGEILQKLFNGIAILMNNQSGGIVRPLMIIFASISGLWIISKSFFSASTESILQKYFFPLLVVLGLFLIPSKTVRIEDAVTNRYYKIDHVPFLLAQFSQLSSSIGYRITEAIDSVMHSPNDLRYNKTGMVFGAENALEVNKYKIRNGDFGRNLREFSKQCVFYDLLLGKYTQDEMQKTTDLWKFLEENTSNVRMIDYIDTKTNTNKKSTSTITCRESVKKMTPDFKKETNYYALQDIGKNLPLAYQTLTGMKEEAEDLISQQLLFDFFGEGFDSQGFAKRRAEHQQLTTYQTIGALAATGIVSTRAVIEALIYASFIFIFPMAILPMGFRFLSTWIWLVVWIQLWPPFFAIISYIMQCAAQAQSDAIFNGLSKDEKGLSFFTSIGIFDLNQNIAALSGYLIASIPFISYAIIQGGLSSFGHLASSITSTSSGAASSAANELSTGNYSFANTNFGQESFKNRTALQNNLAPSLSSGYFTQSDGSATVTYGTENILRQHGSEFRNNLFSDESLSSSLNRSYQEAETYAKSSQHNLTESLSNHTKNYGDLTNYLSKSENIGENFTGREGVSLQESANYMKNAAESLSNQFGISERTSFEIVATPPGFLKTFLPIDPRFSDSNATEEAWNAAKNITESENYQKHYQNINDWASSVSAGSLNDEGLRLVEGYSKSIDEMHSATEQYQHSLSKMEQVSENKSFAENLSISERKSLNQEFVNWASEKYESEGGFGKVKDILMQDSSYEKDSLIHEFLSSHSPVNDIQPSNAHESYENSFFEYASFKSEMTSNQQNDIFDTVKNGLKNGMTASKEKAQQEFPTHIHSQIKTSKTALDKSLEKEKLTNSDKTDEYHLHSKAKDLRNSVSGLVNTFVESFGSTEMGSVEKSLRQKPFWYEEN